MASASGLILVIAAAFASVGCEVTPIATRGVDASSADALSADASSDIARATTWQCPEGWVPGSAGGCGPSVWLCEADAGAADGACAAEREDASPFRHGTDGALLGPWSASDSGGPPLEWSPDAGIHACPVGWMLRPDQTCDPSLPTHCPENSEPLPGGACTAAEACGETPWPALGSLPPGTSVMRVRSGASDDGADGSERAPFGTIARAVSAAGNGGVVLVTDGVYPTALHVTGALTIVGRCASRVVLLGADDASAVFRVSGDEGGLSVRGVTIRGGTVGLSVEGPAHGELRVATLEGSSRNAVIAAGVGAVATLTDVVSRTTLAATPAIGLSARGGARLVVSRSSLRGASEIGLTAFGVDSHITLEDAVVSGGVFTPGSNPMALFASNGATLEIARVVVEHGDGQGLVTSTSPGARTTVTLRDLVLRDLRAANDGAVQAVLNGAYSDLNAARVLIENCRGFSSWVNADSSASITIRDAVFRAPTSTSDAAPAVGLATGEFGRMNRIDAVGIRIENARLAGVDLHEFGTVEIADSEIVRASGGDLFRALSLLQPNTVATARRLRVTGLHGAAVSVQAEGAHALIEDSLFHWADDDQPQRADDIHPTVLVTTGGALDLTRTRISNPPALGVVVDGLDAVIRLDGSTIERTREVPGANVGFGVLASHAARCELNASRVEGARVGLVGTDVADVQIDGSMVRGLVVTDSAGIGVLLRAGAHATVARSLIERVEAFGVVLLGDDTSLDAEDLAIRDTRGTRALQGGALDEAILGVGIAVTQGSRATLRRVIVSDVRGAAIMAAISASRDGGVTGSGAATIDAEDVFVRRVTGASLGTASGRASVSMAVGALSGEAGVVSVRRALFDDGVDGVLTFSQRTTLREVVATHQRGCGLRTGTAVSNSEESARAVTTVGAESGPCLRSVVGDVSLAVIDL